MTTTVALEVNTENLIHNLRMAFHDNTTFLAELMQNARRAGASWVAFDWDGETLTVTDNGQGIDNMQNLLAVCKSGWDDAIQETEHPYGMGFLAALYTADHVRIDSQGQCLDFDTVTILQFDAIPVESSPITFGTRLQLTGINIEDFDSRLKHLLETYAKGFPIAVYFNHEELSRPHAIDCQENDFMETDIGLVHLHEFKDPYPTSESTALGTSGVVVYLQGIQVHSERRYPFMDNIVHLDSTQFLGKMPDRHRLENHNSVIKTVEALIGERWQQRLEQDAKQMDQADFVTNAYATMQKWKMLHLLNEIDLLPPDMVKQADRYPVITQPWERGYGYVYTPVSKQDMENGAATVFIEHGDREEGEAMQEFMYHYHLEGYVITAADMYQLDKGHWLHQPGAPVYKVSPDSLELELVNPGKGDFFDVFGDDYEVIDCDKALLHGPAGTVTIEEEAFLYRSGIVRHQGETTSQTPTDEDQNDVELIVMPRQTRHGDVVRQVSDYLDDEIFQEREAHRDEHRFIRLVLSHRPGNEADLVKQVLDKSELGDYRALKGKTFEVTIADTGGGETHVTMK